MDVRTFELCILMLCGVGLGVLSISIGISGIRRNQIEYGIGRLNKNEDPLFFWCYALSTIALGAFLIGAMIYWGFSVMRGGPG
jgi:hypothetical protein